MRPELVVALDVPGADRIGSIVDALPAEVGWYKVGLELFAAAGPTAIEPLRNRGKSVFLDLKLHDIPRTVARAVRAAAAHGVRLLTVHAAGGGAMVEAACAAAREFGADRPRIVAVTLLTSLDTAEVERMGWRGDPADVVRRLAGLALDHGADGLVCSPREAGELRARFGAAVLLVTPGIRLPGDAPGDQRRTGTPAEAVRAGATHLVVGRPILEAPDPAAASRAVLADIAAAVSE
ncbi:MAG: orotidine-5'-phosphate decarboxylase [Kiritimatiellae bacterium]|nr:orotidine-5'-phosphate decarboxylase [Kiritimatiellia bacterium]